MNEEMRSFLLDLFLEAVRVVKAGNCLPPHLPPIPRGGRLIVLGAGKAAADMAAVAEAYYRAELGEEVAEQVCGLVITRYGHGAPTSCIEVVEAGHPVPDMAGLKAAKRLFGLAAGAGKHDLVLFLLSGGGSALLTMPRRGVSLEMKQRVIGDLMRKGAGIAEMNCVRKHLSDIKGGKLALAAAPARILTLAISDVAGDDPGVIASGPSVYDETTARQAYEILQKYEIVACRQLGFLLESESKPGRAAFSHAEYVLVARPVQALEAAAALARARGWQVRIQGDALEGNAVELARAHAAEILGENPGQKGVVLLSGGEVTVTLTGTGRGGPNQEYALALALALEGADGIHALACDTDGNDGGRGRADDPAGAIISPSTLLRAVEAGLDPVACLANNDSGGFFVALGDLVQIGPTLTNVNDFRAILRRP